MWVLRDFPEDGLKVGPRVLRGSFPIEKVGNCAFLFASVRSSVVRGKPTVVRPKTKLSYANRLHVPFVCPPQKFVHIMYVCADGGGFFLCDCMPVRGGFVPVKG